jgi:hypothetical protein
MSQNIKLRVADSLESASEQAKNPKGEKKPKKTSEAGKPTKALPTVRIAFGKQLDLLRAYAAASGPAARMVNLKDVAEIVQMSPTTIPLANPFFVDVKFVQRSEGQGMTPASELLEYAHAYEWDKETAAHKLSPLLTKTWFWEALQPRLAFQELSDDQAVTILAEKSGAGPTYKSPLRLILDYLEAAGMVKREGGMVKMVKGQTAAALQPAQLDEAEPEVVEAAPKGGPLPRTSVATNFAQSKQGIVQFDISVHVDMAEFKGWQPARIAAFFNGIAQVLSAKGMVEQESGARE